MAPQSLRMEYEGDAGMAKVKGQATVLMALGMALCACVQPPGAMQAGATAHTNDSIQHVGYDTAELERRLLDSADGLKVYSDLAPGALGKRLGLELHFDPERPQAAGGIAVLSNGWVYRVQAWQGGDGEPPPVPVQLYFFPGPTIEPKWWSGSHCFLDSSALLDGLKARGFTVDGQRNDGGLQTSKLSRRSPAAEFIVIVADHPANSAREGNQRCLRKLTLNAVGLAPVGP